MTLRHQRDQRRIPHLRPVANASFCGREIRTHEVAPVKASGLSPEHTADDAHGEIDAEGTLAVGKPHAVATSSSCVLIETTTRTGQLECDLCPVASGHPYPFGFLMIW